MSGEQKKDHERRVEKYLSSLDEAGTGECPECLFPWVMGYSDHDKELYVDAYWRLGSVRILVGYSAISGLANSKTEWVVRNELPAYCMAHVMSRKSLPVGLHRITTGHEDITALLNFKFPDHPLPICMRSNGRKDISLGPAAALEEDWYFKGYKVHRIGPDDPPEVILRSPIRNRWDAKSVALALCRARACPGFMEPRSAAVDANTLADELAGIAEHLLEARKYPVNLAEIYRHFESAIPDETGLNEPLRLALAEAIAGYARSVMERTAWHGDEAARIRKALFPEKAS